MGIAIDKNICQSSYQAPQLIERFGQLLLVGIKSGMGHIKVDIQI